MSDEYESARNLEILLERLAELARRGPIPTTVAGDTGVGMTLLHALGIKYSSTAKPNFRGIVVTASRHAPTGRGNRVNLFAQVPEWSRSACKSSREIVERYGYSRVKNEYRLYCTVRSRRPNSQGLYLEIDQARGLLAEVAHKAGRDEPVATWEISKLRERLLQSHPQSVWVSARVTNQKGQECFHYRYAAYTGPPRVDEVQRLLDAGTITVDHLIMKRGNKVVEKGPLFKIKPSNIELLFPSPRKFDLMTLPIKRQLRQEGGTGRS